MLTRHKAAAMMSHQGQVAASRPPRTSSARPDYNKPSPAVPSQRYDSRPDDRYNGGGGGGGGRGGGGGYESRPPPGAYQDSRYDGRAQDPRFDSRQEPRRDERFGVGSPPPANYGHGPPPQGSHGRPQLAQQSRPPPTPAPPRDANDREALWRLFVAVDKDSM